MVARLHTRLTCQHISDMSQIMMMIWLLSPLLARLNCFRSIVLTLALHFYLSLYLIIIIINCSKSIKLKTARADVENKAVVVAAAVATTMEEIEQRIGRTKEQKNRAFVYTFKVHAIYNAMQLQTVLRHTFCIRRFTFTPKHHDQLFFTLPPPPSLPPLSFIPNLLLFFRFPTSYFCILPCKRASMRRRINNAFGSR